MKNVTIIAVLLLCNICLAQNNSYPTPTIGWDSLKSLIKYPELARRAGLEGHAIVTVEVYSIGEIKNISILSDAEIFKATIEEAVKKTKWNPALKDGQAVESRVRFPINFIMTEMWEGPRMFIEVGPAKFNGEYYIIK
jgi:TonB family protein